MEKIGCWKWNDNCLEIEPEGYYGFIYLITFHGRHLTAKEKKDLEYPIGSIYIGKKAFMHKTKTVLSKRARLKPENKRKKVVRSTKNSGWLSYYGSSLTLKKFITKYGRENFDREILYFCSNKTELSYVEVVKQIEYNVLQVPSFNGWISCKIFRSHLNK